MVAVYVYFNGSFDGAYPGWRDAGSGGLMEWGFEGYGGEGVVYLEIGFKIGGGEVGTKVGVEGLMELGLDGGWF